MAFALRSSAFVNGGKIPSLYTCDEKDINPQLEWSDAPENTKSFVLIMDDPDAPGGIWDHWIVYNIPSNITELKENIGTDLPMGTKQGRNSWGKNRYDGPCPPDREHRYFFKLYALDISLNEQEGLSKIRVEEIINDHILAKAELIGSYKR
jgi:Raf kinase inhibitor-like YbhB/YbcL family protein